MSINPNKNDITEYIASILNIDISNKLIVIDMMEDLKEIQDLAGFRTFAKERLNHERFRYLTGYQKFISLVNEWKKENKPKLDDEAQDKADSYSEKLFSKITSIANELHFEMQTRGIKLDSIDMEQTLLKNGLKDHHISVLRAVGDKKKLFHLCVYGKQELRARIESIVNKKTIAKVFQLGYDKKEKFEGIATIERLKIGSGNECK